jgi:hypothetical protein
MVIGMKTGNETRTAQEQFTFEVCDALNRACEGLDSTCEGVNRDFAREVKLDASMYGMSRCQLGKALADFERNEADIATGPSLRLPPLNVIDVLLSAYETVLGADEACRIRKCIENEDKEA